MIMPSQQYKDYEHDCGYFLGRYRGIKISEPVEVRCEYYMPTRRRVDLTNLMEATHDILVAYDILEDDNSSIIASVDGSRVYYDKQNPRTVIWIKPYEGNHI